MRITSGCSAELRPPLMTRLARYRHRVFVETLGWQLQCRDAIARVLRGEQSTFKFEERLRTGTGEWRWVLCGGAVTERDADGNETLRETRDDAIREMMEEASKQFTPVFVDACGIQKLLHYMYGPGS